MVLDVFCELEKHGSLLPSYIFFFFSIHSFTFRIPVPVLDLGDWKGNNVCVIGNSLKPFWGPQSWLSPLFFSTPNAFMGFPASWQTILTLILGRYAYMGESYMNGFFLHRRLSKETKLNTAPSQALLFAWLFYKTADSAIWKQTLSISLLNSLWLWSLLGLRGKKEGSPY